jgi:O-antigen/teichoic acid export membrane protein
MADEQEAPHSRIITPLCDDDAVDPEVYVPPAPARLRTDVFVTFGGKAATLFFGLVTAAIIARHLGPSGQGLFAVAYSLTLMLVQVGGLGLTTANPYFAARRPGAIPRIIANALWLAALLGVALVAAGILIKAAIPGLLEGLDWTPLLVTLAGIPGALAALFLQSVLLGEGRMVAYNAIEVTQAALTLVALAACYAFFDVGLTGTLVVLGAARYVAAAAYFLILSRRTRVVSTPDPGLARSMLRYGFRVYVAILVSFLVIRLDLLLVNAYLGQTEAGLYSVAATLADGMFVLPTVIGLNLLPRVARGDPTDASAEVFRSVAVLYGLLCLLTVPVAGPVIRLFFGERYVGATSLYYWLLPGIFCLGMLTILSHHFAGRGYPPQAIAFWLFGLALNIALNLVFLPGRGAWVAALTSSITYAVLLVLHMWLFVQEAGHPKALIPRPGEVARFVRVAFSR